MLRWPRRCSTLAKGKAGMFSAFREEEQTAKPADGAKKPSVETTQKVSSKPVVNTDNVSKLPVKATEKPQKAVRKNYSLYPDIIKAIERYANDNYISQSAVITQAVRNYIPEKYFK
jgi:hypothetical protein